jgi:hypothetical protein
VVEQQILPPDQSRVYYPFSVERPDPQLKGFVVALCHLRECVRYELAEGLRAFGVAVHFRISEHTKVAVADESNPKLKQTAGRYNIPIVKTTWVMELLETGELPDYAMFSFHETASTSIRTLCTEIQQRSFIIKGRIESGGLIPRMSSQSLGRFSDDEDGDTNSSPRIKVGYKEPLAAGRIALTDPEIACDPLLDLL